MSEFRHSITRRSRGPRPSIYLSARISPNAHAWNNAVSDVLKDCFDVFKPQDNNPCDVPHEQLQVHVYQLDLDAMEKSDLGLLVPPYGRDCAWEAGWYAGTKKPLMVYIEDEFEWLRDWMLKGGLTAVITANPAAHRLLCADAIVHDRCHLISTRAELPDVLLALLAA